MTVKELCEKLSELPGDMPVAVNVGVAEDQGTAHRVKVCHGESEVPYCKGDNVFQTGAVEAGAKVCFILA